MNPLNDPTDYYETSSRERDTHLAMECLEEVLNELALISSRSKDIDLESVMVKTNRAFNLLDRHYGELAEFEINEPLDFEKDYRNHTDREED